jgi:predicted ABC-type exoprotein transport system permease subunit
MTRARSTTLLVAALVLALPATALAHDQPETKQSNWIMADWMLEAFFLFAGFALVAFLIAWKAGHFHNLERAARIPLLIHEEDYYTPAWALDEEEWDDDA